jgi:hypothetical protein
MFAEGVHKKFPGKMLAYNCSPSFNWKKHLDDATIAKFQRELGAMGYKFQFVTLAGFHSLNILDVRPRPGLRDRRAWPPTRELQRHEFAAEKDGYTATKHQREVGHRLLRSGRPGDLGRRCDGLERSQGGSPGRQSRTRPAHPRHEDVARRDATAFERSQGGSPGRQSRTRPAHPRHEDVADHGLRAEPGRVPGPAKPDPTRPSAPRGRG